MKKSRFSEEQIAFALKQAELGTKADAFEAHLHTDFIGTVDLHVDLPDAFDVRHERLIALDACTAQGRIALLRGMAPVA